jgi:hypothetical protein
MDSMTRDGEPAREIEAGERRPKNAEARLPSPFGRCAAGDGPRGRSPAEASTRRVPEGPFQKEVIQ